MIKYDLTMWDAGHTLTGADTGAEGNGIKEQELTREIVNWCDKYCLYLGLATKYAHCNSAKSVNESLQYRVDKQKSTGAKAFVSIHGNSFSQKSANGTEVFISAPGGEAERIAKRINSKLVALGFADRTFGKGYKVASHKVTRDTTCPAVLVETFFLTSDTDVALFKKIGGAKRIAHAIVEGLYDVSIPYDIEKPAEKPKERWCIKSYAYGSKEEAEKHAKYFKDNGLYHEVYKID